jgi:tol-pal system protein YbgF
MHMGRRFPVLVLSLLIVATVISMPATGANREHQQMMAEVRILEEHSLQLQADIAGVNAALKALAAKLDEQAVTARRAFADQKVLADNVAGDLRVLREKVDDNNVRVGSLSQELEAIRQAVTQISTQPAGELEPGAEPPPGQPPQPAAALGMSPQKLFDTAWGDYTVGQFDLAITGFTNYIKAFPTLEKAGEAQWYVGESYFGKGDYKSAIAAYDRVIGDYPDSRLVPDAYYKRGVAYSAVELPDRARESWEFVVKTYPSSDAGRLARQKLDQLIRKEPALP